MNNKILFFSKELARLCIENSIRTAFVTTEGTYIHTKCLEEGHLKQLPKSSINNGYFITEFPHKNWVVQSWEIPACTEEEVHNWFYAKLLQSSF
jgi:hypothetical protein